MAKDKKEYWFKAKKYGWGWGLPNNRQGLLAYVIFLAVWAAALAWYVSSYSDTNEPPLSANLTLAAIIAADIVCLVVLAAKHGETPQWRWGGKTREERKAAKSKSD